MVGLRADRHRLTEHLQPDQAEKRQEENEQNPNPSANELRLVAVYAEPLHKERLREIRGLLTPFLRDTLVGLNYAHYAPPGAQVLHTNPLFVRSHDFLGLQGSPQTWKQTEVFGSGWPSSAGGRLVGSLVGLPYALAEAEQNFLIPTREQALIWGDLVPQMILSAKVPRWWNVTPAQLQWVSMHLNQGETLAAEAALNSERRTEFVASLHRHAPPVRVRHVAALLEEGRVPEAIESITPAELYLVATDWRSSHTINPGVGSSDLFRSSLFLNWPT